MGNVEKLIVDGKEGLEREIHAFRDEMRTRFDTQAARLERHAALWQTGRRWSGRMDEWAEKIDAALEVKNREIAELRDQVKELQKRSEDR